jgi:hypothetical protein
MKQDRKPRGDTETTFFGAAFDVADAAHAAHFWAAALNREVADGADEQNAVVEAADPAADPDWPSTRSPKPRPPRTGSTRT